jgi:choline kinase
MTQSNGRSVIAIDDVHRLDEIDSPGTIIDSGRIYDLGRHIPRSKNGGYAIGVYKFNEELSRAFFKEAETLLSNNIQAGFHDPLPSLFKNYPVYAHSTQGLSWADVDEPAEIPQMERTIKRIIKEEQN